MLLTAEMFVQKKKEENVDDDEVNNINLCDDVTCADLTRLCTNFCDNINECVRIIIFILLHNVYMHLNHLLINTPVVKYIF